MTTYRFSLVNNGNHYIKRELRVKIRKTLVTNRSGRYEAGYLVLCKLYYFCVAFYFSRRTPPNLLKPQNKKSSFGNTIYDGRYY